MNDPAHPLKSSQFFNLPPASVDDQAECGGSGWYDEQALDVESSHSMAPGADILFVGAQDCQDTSLLAALQTAVTSGASVVSDSWGDTLGDLFTDAATKTAFDDTFMLRRRDRRERALLERRLRRQLRRHRARGAGLSAEQSVRHRRRRHDSRGQREQRAGGRVRLVDRQAADVRLLDDLLRLDDGDGSARLPGRRRWRYELHLHPAVLPGPRGARALALRNEALFGPVPLRVEPDISMDADAQTGMLIGLTQTFPNGVYYDQFKEGGTSLASPLLAGVIADADQAAGVSLGFLNPTLYKAYTRVPDGVQRHRASGQPELGRVVRVDYANTVDSSDGYIVSLRAFDYQGPETYCDGTGNCATRNVTLTTTKGFDSMTGLGSVGPAFLSALAKF